MKQSRIFFGLIAIILVSMVSTGCDVRKLTTFTLGPFSTSVTIPGSSAVGTLIDNLPFSSDTPTNSDVTLSGNGTGKDYVDAITLSDMTLTVETPASGNFNFLKEIRVIIAADGLPEKEIASKTNIADGLTKLDMDETGENLKEYLTAAKFRLKTKVILDGVPSEDTKINIATSYLVQANVLKKK
jgi:hypothetical protein